MNINNLLFFDRNGESYNFSKNSNGSWEGAEYFLPVSTALYDVSNLFILEKTQAGYRFPKLEPGSSIIAKWKTSDSSDNLFLFTFTKDPNNNDATLFIDRQKSVSIKYSELSQDPLNQSNLDLAYPLQLNIGFCPTEEISYERTLELYYETSNSTTLILSLKVYGEGEDEDERFRIWLENFGIKFNREDALLLKDYDLKEGLPDWKQINLARKELLVNRDQVYPYIGTYKGLTNLISLLGYRDVLRVKEYWQDNDSKSEYYKKYALLDITDLLNIGDKDEVNLVDMNGQIKKGGKFKKTEFLALSYQFSVASDQFDDDGVPEVEYTTEFEVDEIFYKLNRLATKLKTEILPVNVIIKDIIGEFIYFNKFNLRYWSDLTYVSAVQVNDDYSLNLNTPILKSQVLQIRDIKTLYSKTNGTSAFPIISFNMSGTNPYESNQQYPAVNITGLITAISDYYSNIKNYEFNYHGQGNPMFLGDEAHGKIGCPVVLEAYIKDFTLEELDGSKFSDFSNSHFTIGNIRYRNGYEVEWSISGPRGYIFNWRTSIQHAVKLPHVFPYVGKYEIKATVHDLQGGQNLCFLNLTVDDEQPAIEFFTRLQDKNVYNFANLTNITISDLGNSPLFLPFVNVYQANQIESRLPSHYLDWYTYSNNFGLGDPQSESFIYTNGIGFEQITSSSNPIKIQYGTGSGNGQATLFDYSIASFQDLSLNRLSDFSYASDKINGFYIDFTAHQYPIFAINFGNWDPLYDFQVPSYIDAKDLANKLNLSTDEQVSQYRYSVINGNVHAQAKLQDATLNRIILIKSGLQPVQSTVNVQRVYTFCYPKSLYSVDLISKINQELEQVELIIDDDLLFLNVPFKDCLRKTGETVTSNTQVSLITPPISPITFVLNREQEFQNLNSQTHYVRAYSESNPNEYIDGIASQSNLNELTLTVFATSSLPVSANDWKFKYKTVFLNTKETNAPASDINYWINKGFISFEDSVAPNFKITGFLPSNSQESGLSLNNLKIGANGLVIPLHTPIFAAVSNIETKKQTVWTLFHENEELVKMQTPSFFIWRFDEPGNYYIKCEVTDTNDNVYILTNSINAASVKDIKSYRKIVEDSLNLRKAKIK
jgi:hypothetical protein